MTLPAVPNRGLSGDEFVPVAHTFLAALPKFEADMNTLYASMSSMVAGGAISIPFIFDGTSNTAGDPGSGKLRMDQFVNQNTATALYINVTGSNGVGYSSVIEYFDDSTSGVKGQIRLVKSTDQTKWMLLNVWSQGGTGWKSIVVSVAAASEAKPFTTGDQLLMFFSRTGDVGSPGTILRRTFTSPFAASVSVDVTAHDMVVITAQNQNLTIAAPTGSPTAGQQMVLAIKDNGTSRPIAYNTIFRASADLPFVTATNPGKWLYIGFFYNSTDSKWDMISVLNNI